MPSYSSAEVRDCPPVHVRGSVSVFSAPDPKTCSVCTAALLYLVVDWVLLLLLLSLSLLLLLFV